MTLLKCQYSIKPRVKTLLIGETEIQLIQEASLDKHYHLETKLAYWTLYVMVTGLSPAPSL